MPHSLDNGRGESLVETLVALLVAAFALMAFSGMIAAARRTVETGRDWNADINRRAALLEQRKASETVTSGDKTVIPIGGTVSISGLIEDNTSVTFYFTKYGGEDVIAYEKQSGS